MEGLLEKLDWQTTEVANIYDEVSLWTAPFGRLMLENIPMLGGGIYLDLGFGTGFPLLELAQRLGQHTEIHGMDIWVQAIERSREKIRVLGLDHIIIHEQDARQIPLEDDSVDVVCSNLGVNNFEEKDQVYAETFRVLKEGGRLCITTNPVGTFDELFQIFLDAAEHLGLNDIVPSIQKYIDHRNTAQQIIDEIEAVGLRHEKLIRDATHMRFCDALSVFNHGLIRIGFLASWETLVPEAYRLPFFSFVRESIQSIIQEKGEFGMRIPMLYLAFVK